MGNLNDRGEETERESKREREKERERERQGTWNKLLEKNVVFM